jgi:polyisoprenyl-teichoic acid--peptidoglycan teichoic acid transferase
MNNNKKYRRKKKKTGTLRFTMFALLYVVLFAVAFTVIYTYKSLGDVQSISIDKSHKELGIKPEAQQKIKDTKKEDEIINIALFGMDQRSLKERGRSDSIIIVSIDKAHKKIKLSSIIRDSYVSINGHGKDKINHAYAFGGPQLAVRTLNENFHLNIKDYVTVNFFSMADIIDALGGVEMNIKSYEVNEMNKYIREVARIENSKYTPITKTGPQTLNGAQAVSYSRIRKVGNGDYERTERQRRVVTALMEKVKSAGVTEYPGLVSKLLPYVATSMSKSDIIKTGLDVLSAGATNIEQERFPTDTYGKGERIDGIYYFTFDEEATINQLFKYIYEDIKPETETSEE